jgi:NADH:ubiquinone oxidoreductase subunit F (NADH-binding)
MEFTGEIATIQQRLAACHEMAARRHAVLQELAPRRGERVVEVGCEKAVKLMQADHWDQGLLSELCEVMMDASICGLGEAAPNPILLTMKYFGDEV